MFTCTVCGKTRTESIPKLIVPVNEATNKYKAGSEKNLLIQFSASFPNVVSVSVDGEELDADSFEWKADNKTIELNSVFLSKLAVGEHVLIVTYEGGEAKAEFYVEAAGDGNTNTQPPQTGDVSGMIYPFVGILALGGILLINLAKNRRNQHQ